MSVVLLLAACAPAEQEMAEEEVATDEADLRAIEAVRDREVAALDAENMEGFLGAFAPDAVWLPPDSPALEDREALRGFLGPLLTDFDWQVEHSTEELRVDGDWALERWFVDMTLTPRDGGDAMTERVKGLHVYQRQPDGSWSIAYDVWNRVAPSPE